MLSTGVNVRGIHGIFQMDGGVQISVDCMAARLTDEHSIGQCQAFVLPSTARTGLAAGKQTPCLDDGDAWQLDASIQHLDGSAESAQSVLAGLALGKFHPQPLAFPLFADVPVVNQLSTPAWRLRSAS